MFLDLLINSLHGITRQAINSSSGLDDETCDTFTKAFDEAGCTFLFSSLERLRNKASNTIEEPQAEFLHLCISDTRLIIECMVDSPFQQL